MCTMYLQMPPHSDSSNSCEGYRDDDDYDDDGGWFCIYWYQPIILIMGYVLYALTCSFYTKIIATFCPYKVRLLLHILRASAPHHLNRLLCALARGSICRSAEQAR